MSSRFLGSVVIPAHNEAAVIGRCLTSLSQSPLARRCEVVVVANGCADDTVAVARGFQSQLPELTVLDVPQASKAVALNTGDAAASAFPRVYLDADIELTGAALADLLEALAVDQPAVASPTVQFDTSHASTWVKRFYAVYSQIPYVQRGLIGLGVYALNQSGRARFTDFPQLSADDLFVQRLFQPEERVVVASRFVVRVPRTLADLIRVRTRVAAGNVEFEARADELPHADDLPVDPSSSTRQTLLGLLAQSRRRPRLIPSVAVYVYVIVRARRQARRVGTSTWMRDHSSRQAIQEQ